MDPLPSTASADTPQVNATVPPIHLGPSAAGRIAIALGFILGTWMLVDGAHRLITGDFVRIHGQLGPWANFVAWMGANPMQFGPVLIVLGVAWLIGANVYLFQNSAQSWRGMVLLVILSSWYAGPASLALVVQLALLLLPETRLALRPDPQAEALSASSNRR